VALVIKLKKRLTLLPGIYWIILSREGRHVGLPLPELGEISQKLFSLAPKMYC